MNETPTSNRVAWVTGASCGIGRALARRLARRARSSPPAPAPPGPRCPRRRGPRPHHLFPPRCHRRKDCVATGQLIEVPLGPIDLAIFNAGSYFPTTAEDFSVDNFRKTVDVNLMGEINCMGPVAPLMVSRRRGHIVLMASLTGYVGLPTAASYGATKAALISVAQAFKPDFERFGVTISVVNPGFIKTPATDKNEFPMPFLIGADEAVDHIMRGIERKRSRSPSRGKWCCGIRTSLRQSRTGSSSV